MKESFEVDFSSVDHFLLEIRRLRREETFGCLVEMFVKKCIHDGKCGRNRVVELELKIGDVEL